MPSLYEYDIVNCALTSNGKRLKTSWPTGHIRENLLPDNPNAQASLILSLAYLQLIYFLLLYFFVSLFPICIVLPIFYYYSLYFLFCPTFIQDIQLNVYCMKGTITLTKATLVQEICIICRNIVWNSFSQWTWMYHFLFSLLFVAYSFMLYFLNSDFTWF